MEPIISPWIFYWMDVARALKITLVILTIAGVFVMFFAAMSNDINGKPIIPAIKPVAIAMTIALFILAFIPSKDTMYKMLVTSYITPNNIELVGGSIDNALDKLTDKAIRIKEAK